MAAHHLTAATFLVVAPINALAAAEDPYLYRRPVGHIAQETPFPSFPPESNIDTL